MTPASAPAPPLPPDRPPGAAALALPATVPRLGRPTKCIIGKDQNHCLCGDEGRAGSRARTYLSACPPAAAPGMPAISGAAAVSRSKRGGSHSRRIITGVSPP